MWSVIADLEINDDKEWMSWLVLTMALWSSSTFVFVSYVAEIASDSIPYDKSGTQGVGALNKSFCKGRLGLEPFIYILHRKGIPFVYLLTNETPLTHQVKNTEPFLTIKWMKTLNQEVFLSFSQS